MTCVYLVRHGHTEDVGKRLAGRLPGRHLDARGREEVARLGESLARTRIAAVYSSPLERCVETALAVATPHDLEVEVHAALNEVDFGEWTGALIDELRGDARFRHYNEHRAGNRAPSGEHAAEVAARMARELSELRDRYPDGNVVVVSHSDPLKAALAHFVGIPPDLAHRLELDPASLTLLEMWPGDVSLRYVNRPAGSPA